MIIALVCCPVWLALLISGPRVDQISFELLDFLANPYLQLRINLPFVNLVSWFLAMSLYQADTWRKRQFLSSAWELISENPLVTRIGL